ncbi:MAG TPA: RsmE family RNA methyltransferase [Terriglobales bacterium]|nr:RsmE family RNA methyltransferase [Terriglobales bacterium]
MTRRRWIADLVSGDQAFLLGKNADHLSRVLRARLGEQFEIATPTGVRLGEIVDIQPERVVFATRELPQTADDQHAAMIDLCLAIFKFDRFEWAIEKCTEIGVSRIIPMIAHRTDAHLASAAQRRVQRWRRIAHEAAQQSRRDTAPEITEPAKLDRVIGNARGKAIVLAENEREQKLTNVVDVSSELSLAVGPEGGWTEVELSLLNQSGWSAASLGRNILRAETAAIVGLAIAHSKEIIPPPIT